MKKNNTLQRKERRIERKRRPLGRLMEKINSFLNKIRKVGILTSKQREDEKNQSFTAVSKRKMIQKRQMIV
jgi:hypothetical protein